MKIPSAKTLRDMELAAELRAAGATWDTIGQKLNRHPNLLIRWTKHYGEEWDRLLRDAERRTGGEGTAESRFSMRQLLRHDEPRVRIGAVDQLTKLLRAERTTVKQTDGPEDLSAFLNHIEEMSDEELEEILAEFTEHYRNKSGSRSDAGRDKSELRSDAGQDEAGRGGVEGAAGAK